MSLTVRIRDHYRLYDHYYRLAFVLSFFSSTPTQVTVTDDHSRSRTFDIHSHGDVLIRLTAVPEKGTIHLSLSSPSVLSVEAPPSVTVEGGEMTYTLDRHDDRLRGLSVASDPHLWMGTTLERLKDEEESGQESALIDRWRGSDRAGRDDCRLPQLLPHSE